MRILLASHHFLPSIGGIQTVSKLLVREFIRAGHEVRVVTFTPEKNCDNGRSGGDEEAEKRIEVDDSYSILRFSEEDKGKHYKELLNWLRWCDVFFQNQIGLRTLNRWIFTKKPLVISTHTWLPPSWSLHSWLKQCCLHFSHRVYASRALELQTGLQGKVIYNPYEKCIFYSSQKEKREGDLIFVGRLVSDKGVALLLRALRRIIDEGLPLRLTIVGKGPEKEALCTLRRNLGLEECVIFKGELLGEELARELRQHKILVVPSLWNEPFGIVAVEAIACGCVVVGSDGGGLPEAIGPCGETFPNGDRERLSALLLSLLREPEQLEKFRIYSRIHLQKFSPAVSAAQYLDLFASCCAK